MHTSIPRSEQTTQNLSNASLQALGTMLDEMVMNQKKGGIQLRVSGRDDFVSDHQAIVEYLTAFGVDLLVEKFIDTEAGVVGFRMRKDEQSRLPQAHNTLQLCDIYKLDPLGKKDDLLKEIILAMLLGPITFEYPSYREFVASVNIRCNIVMAARQTALAFHTSKIERPTDYWTYSEEKGFTVLPGMPFIDALRKATQPDISGEKYAFSCYRATEYVILLGLAEELATCNPELLQGLQQQWESRAIKSREFHEVFLQEYGSMNDPLPYDYYVPGDRLWFRNPDPVSGEVTGFEGSWVFYLGNGLFTNFWERDKFYTLTSKCIEIYHWRHGVYTDAEGIDQMNESIVEECVRATRENPDEVKRILELMLRLRDPLDTNTDGGCIDASREYPRWVCPETSEIVLPNIVRQKERVKFTQSFKEFQMFKNLSTWTLVRQLPAFIAGVAVCAFINVSYTPEFLAANAKVIATEIDKGAPPTALNQELSRLGERACVFKGKDDAKYVIVIPKNEQDGLVEVGKALVDKNIPTGMVGISPKPATQSTSTS